MTAEVEKAAIKAWTCVPLKEYLVISNQYGQTQWLLHTTTLEYGALPKGEWTITADGDEAVLEDASNKEAPLLFASDILKQRLARRHSEGRLVVVEDRKGKEVAWSIEGWWRKGEEMEVRFKLYPAKLPQEWPVRKFYMKRSGFRLAWSTDQLYRYCAMSAYKNHQSNWWTKNCSLMNAKLSNLGVAPTHCFHSYHSENLKKTKPVDWQILEYTPNGSLTTFGLLFFLPRWAFCKEGRSGGLRGDNSADAARFLLRSLISGCCLGGYSLPIRFDSRWSPAWPLHEPAVASWLMPVNADGEVDMAAWQEQVMGPDPWPQKAYSFLREAGLRTNRGTVSLCDFLGCCAKLPVLRSLHLQVSWFLAVHIEKHLLSTIGKAPKNEDVMSLKTFDIMAILCNASRLNSYLLSYNLSCRQSSTGMWDHGFATDKAHVGNSSLSNTILTWGENTAAFAAPWVRGVGTQYTAARRPTRGPWRCLRGFPEPNENSKSIISNLMVLGIRCKSTQKRELSKY